MRVLHGPIDVIRNVLQLLLHAIGVELQERLGEPRTEQQRAPAAHHSLQEVAAMADRVGFRHHLVRVQRHTELRGWHIPFLAARSERHRAVEQEGDLGLDERARLGLVASAEVQPHDPDAWNDPIARTEQEAHAGGHEDRNDGRQNDPGGARAEPREGRSVAEAQPARRLDRGSTTHYGSPLVAFGSRLTSGRWEPARHPNECCVAAKRTLQLCLDHNIQVNDSPVWAIPGGGARCTPQSWPAPNPGSAHQACGRAPAPPQPSAARPECGSRSAGQPLRSS